MANQVRVNLKTRISNSAIRYEKREGRDVIIVPSATLPDAIVMNRILYPADTIANGYESLSGTPAPLGHPMAEGMYISASTQQAQNMYSVGAWNENVTRRNGRVFLDKVIDVEVANQTERGRNLLSVIEKQEPISTSTGLMLELEVAEHADYDWVAMSMRADHDAILINEAPAASTQQGVGIFVNKDGVKIDVHNGEIELDEQAMADIARDIAWRIEHEEMEEKRKPLIDKILEAIRGIVGGPMQENEGDALSVNQEGTPMNEAEKKAFDALQEQVADLVANSKDAVTADSLTEALAPLTQAVAGITANMKAADDAERVELTARLVTTNTLDEEDTKELSVNALRKLVAKLPPVGEADSVYGGFKANASADEFSSDLPSDEE